MADKVTLDDVVEVLAKHAAMPSDPDDAATLATFNEQVAEGKTKTAETTTTAKGKP
jgi:hypothetical protein